MGLIKPIDVANVKDREYDVLTALAVNGEYIEEIGEACENPAGYTQGSIFLARNDVVMHLYKATANITAGQAMTIGINCELSSLDAMFKKSGQDLDSVKQALSNEVTARATLGAHNVMPLSLDDLKTANTDGSWSGNAYTRDGITYTVLTDDYGNVTGFNVNGTGTGAPLRLVSASRMARLMNVPIILSCNQTDGLQFMLYHYNGTSNVSTTGDDQEVTITSSAGYPQFYVPSQKTFNNFKVYPLIRLKGDTNREFEPFAMSNRELTDVAQGFNEKYLLLETKSFTYTATANGTLTRGQAAQAARNAFNASLNLASDEYIRVLSMNEGSITFNIEATAPRKNMSDSPIRGQRIESVMYQAVQLQFSNGARLYLRYYQNAWTIGDTGTEVLLSDVTFTFAYDVYRKIQV